MQLWSREQYPSAWLLLNLWVTANMFLWLTYHLQTFITSIVNQLEEINGHIGKVNIDLSGLGSGNLTRRRPSYWWTSEQEQRREKGRFFTIFMFPSRTFLTSSQKAANVLSLPNRSSTCVGSSRDMNLAEGQLGNYRSSSGSAWTSSNLTSWRKGTGIKDLLEGNVFDRKVSQHGKWSPLLALLQRSSVSVPFMEIRFRIHLDESRLSSIWTMLPNFSLHNLFERWMCHG